MATPSKKAFHNKQSSTIFNPTGIRPINSSTPLKPKSIPQSNEPTMSQLLKQQDTSIYPTSTPSASPNKRGRLNNNPEEEDYLKANCYPSWRKGEGFREWEKQILAKESVKRKADLANLCE
jgi:cell cycle protein kinase DBF2